MPDYNLVDKGWIPCLTNDGRMKKLGLLEALRDSHEILGIYDPSPLVTVSLHRLLLAILHRNFGPANSVEWKSLWDRGKWDANRLSEYLMKWHRRFGLFDPDRPFYQCASLSLSYEVPIAKLFHELASGNNATLFDHTIEERGAVMLSDRAACALVACQAFSMGGLITCEKGQLRREFGSADNAPLVKGGVVLVQGSSLFETLMLNMHRYHPRDGEPFSHDEKRDFPAWEKDEEVQAEDRRPDGYLDLLTWQSRRIKLHPEQMDGGKVAVRHAVIMKGYQFPDGYSLHGKETMLAFSKRERPGPGQDPWPAITFREDRALWRDSLALLESVENLRTPPKTVDWLRDLVADDIVQRSRSCYLSVMGLATNRASVALWRHERLPLPLKYLDDEGLLASLRAALEIAEKAGDAIRRSSWYLAKLLIAGDVQRPSRQQQAEISRVSDHLGIASPYWSQLGIIFPRLVTALAEDITRDGQDVLYGWQTVPWWSEEVRRSAIASFGQAVGGLDHSARMLKAVTRADVHLRSNLNTILEVALDPYQSTTRKEVNS